MAWAHGWPWWSWARRRRTSCWRIIWREMPRCWSTRVADLGAAMRALRERGWKSGTRLEIPQGPICSFVDPGGHRLAIYQLTRPRVIESFSGRRDF